MSTSSSYNALLHQKCPRCRQGDVFEYPSTQLSKFAVMHKNCPNCNQNYEPEPGFYFGAMFVAYGLTIAMVFILWLTLFFVFDDPPFSVYIIVIVIFNVLLLPLLFRYSRLIFLYAFGGIRYDSQILNKEK